MMGIMKLAFAFGVEIIFLEDGLMGLDLFFELVFFSEM
uniref:Uncharacterized protein n=1 Tax=Phakopsora pachyrhizi TaxID=170000 RepID=A0A0S1MIH5_PHAPC